MARLRRYHRAEQREAAGLRIHKAHIRHEVSRLFRRLFPERQIFLRSRGEVRFIKLSPALQTAAASGLLLIVVWVLAASTAYLTRDSRLAAKDRQLHFVSEEMNALVGELERLKRDALSRTERLERRQQLLEALVEVPPAEFTASTEEKTSSLTEPTAPDMSAAPAPQSARRPASGQPLLMASVLPVGDGLVLRPAASRRMAETIEQLRRRLAHVESVQESVAGNLAQDQAKRLAEMRGTLEHLGLHPDKLLARARLAPVGVGGPSLDLPMSFDSDAFVLLEKRLYKRGLLTQVMRSLPSIEPAKKFYISSRFGPRRDPFTKRWSRHSGIDMAGWRGEPILAAAAGKVVKAGRAPAYGRMVEIDHGHGIRTRYGHMRKLLVERGQEVGRGQPIGEMGNTGRSTSTHLHWEVWVDDKLVDPLPYLKAVNDVYALQGRSEKAGP